jgi:uncharacterized membrane protein (UPF0127 family)
MKRRLVVVTLALVALLVPATQTFAQSGESSGEIPVTTGTETPQTATSQLPILTIINSNGERVPVQVEIADTPDERLTGLMGRPTLAADTGMLFIFDQEQILSFWMKNTLIPLSVAYIDAEGRIVDIQDMQPLDETAHPSAEPAQYALEVNQGFFAEQGVVVGDMVELPGQDQGGSEAPAGAQDQVAPAGG